MCFYGIAIKHKESDFFQEFYRQNFSLLYFIVLSIISDTKTAKDLLNDVFVDNFYQISESRSSNKILIELARESIRRALNLRAEEDYIENSDNIYARLQSLLCYQELIVLILRLKFNKSYYFISQILFMPMIDVYFLRRSASKTCLKNFEPKDFMGEDL